jgi:nitric oxide reductase NorE protein
MNPPGSLLMWMLVIMEVFMFGALLTVIARFRYLNLDIFLSESTHLQLRDGILFTLTLLVSGFLAAEGVHHFFREQRKKSFTYFTLSASSGLIFLVLKFSDFQSKSNLGLTIGTNDFWQYYWLLMGFHFLHVLVGVFILFSICLGIFRNKVTDSEFSVRGGVLFWHMCDVVWLMILPLYYLGGAVS